MISEIGHELTTADASMRIIGAACKALHADRGTIFHLDPARQELVSKVLP